MKSPDNIPPDAVTTVMASTIILQCQIAVLYTLIQELAEKVGASHLTGEALNDAFRTRTKQAAEKYLLSIENANQGLAAHLQERLERADFLLFDPESFGI
jgi:hypothetical protein